MGETEDRDRLRTGRTELKNIWNWRIWDDWNVEDYVAALVLGITVILPLIVGAWTGISYILGR